MAVLLELLLRAVVGWLPWPHAGIEVPPLVFYPMFALLVAALIRKHALEFREGRRVAVALGQGRQHLWRVVIAAIIISGFRFWFIQS